MSIGLTYQQSVFKRYHSNQHFSEFYPHALSDLGFFLEGGDFGNPSQRSERALRGSGLTGK